MNPLLAFLSKPAVRWPYFGMYAVGTFVYCGFIGLRAERPVAFVGILTSLLELLGLFGFARRIPIIDHRFWRAVFVWSLFWFFWFSAGRHLAGPFLHPSLINLALWTATVAYSGPFFLMLYAYAFVEEGIWL